MIVYFNADGESREFAPGDTSRFELGFFFDYDPTAQEEVTQVSPPAQPFFCLQSQFQGQEQNVQTSPNLHSARLF